MRSELGYGSGCSSTPFTTLKIAVVAPMPSASVSTVTTKKPGLRASERSDVAEIAHERFHGAACVVR